VPVYNLDGDQIASSTDAMFTSPWLSQSINVNQYGNTLGADALVWTGTDPDGTTSTFSLGDMDVNAGDTYSGFADTGDWVDFEQGYYAAGGTELPLYAISSVLTVSDATPEPASFLLTGLGALCFAGLTIIRKR
jgi:hypothetical protein